jgi:glucan phosphoethanolaminetransferase (alkaline phosphatase superfamily)
MKVFSQKIRLNRAVTALLLSAIIIFIHDFNFALDHFSRTVVKNFNICNFCKFFFEIGLHFFLLFAFFFFCSFNKIIFRSAAFILLLFSTIFAFVYNKFGIVIDQTTITNAIDNVVEANNIINFFSLITYAFFLIILPFFLVCKIEIIQKNDKKIFILIAIIFTFFAAILLSVNREVRRGSIVSYSPISLIDSTAEYFCDIYPSLKNRKILKPITAAVPDAKIDAKKAKSLKVVLIIGESARAKNFAINGYERETTPELKKIKNLISFYDVTPAHNLTSYAVSSMLSQQTAKNFSFADNNEESVIKLFEKLGFTTAWLSAQKAVGDNNTLLMIAMQAQKHFFGNSILKNVGSSKVYDGYLLDFLGKEIDNDKDNFVILHAQGSHFLFDDRYPEEFRKFTPVCQKAMPKDCTREELTNAYDNSILYTDYFIAKVIDQLKDKNAILFYISDHGQFLGEGGVYYHGSKGDVRHAEHKIPMLLWMSDKLTSNKFYQKKFSNAKAKINDSLSHDNLFDSLLDCSGIDSKTFYRNLSLCRSWIDFKNTD